MISADYRRAGAVNFAALYDEPLKNKVPNAVFVEPQVHGLLELTRAFLLKNTPPDTANAALQAQALKTASPGNVAAFEEVGSALAVGAAPKSEKQHRGSAGASFAESFPRCGCNVCGKIIAHCEYSHAGCV